MTEEELRLYRLQQARLANEPAKYQSEVGFLEGLLGKTSLEEQHQIMGNRYPDRGKDLRSWGEVPFTETATNILNYIPGVQIGPTADEWATEEVRKADAALNSQQDWSPAAGPNYNPTAPVVEYESILPGRTNNQNLSDEDFARTYRDQMNLAQPTVGTAIGDWLAAQGKRAYQYSELGKVNGQTPYQFAETQLDEIEAKRHASQPEVIEFKRIAAEREAAVKAAEEQRVNNALAQIDALNELEYGEDKSVQMTRQGIFDESMLGTGIEPRNIFNEPTEEIINNGALAVEPAVVQQVEEDSLLEADSIMDSITFESGGILTDFRPGEENTWANMVKPYKEMYSGIKEYYTNATAESIMDDITEWFSGDLETIKRAQNDPANDEFVEKHTNIIQKAQNNPANQEFADKWADAFTRVDKRAHENWERIWAKALGVSADADAEEELNEQEINDLSDAVVELMDESSKNSDSSETLLGDGTASSEKGSGKGVAKNLFEATSGVSTEGFTMDRLKNPLSAENKAWWLEKREGDIPGNNRAVEFFNTLAYIGTPLKYRPAKTPSESLQDRKIQHMNNMMDYSASVASSSASANQNTFTKLKAAVDSQESIAKSIEGEFYGDKGFFEKGSETDRRIQARAGEIREKMLIMASEGIYPTKQKVYDDEEAERKRIEAEQKRKEEEEKKKNPKPENEESWWSDLWPF